MSVAVSPVVDEGVIHAVGPFGTPALRSSRSAPTAVPVRVKRIGTCIVPPLATVLLFGTTAMVTSLGGGSGIISVKTEVLVIELPTPRTVIGYVPGTAVAPTVNANRPLLTFAGSVAGVALNTAPSGGEGASIRTSPRGPVRSSVAVISPDPPRLTVTDVGATDSVKLGGVATTRFTIAVCTSVPSLAVTVSG